MCAFARTFSLPVWLRKEVAKLKTERDILMKAPAYFGKASV